MTSTTTYTPFIPDQFCVYHTTYGGDLLPLNYIGSSSVDNVLNKNYHGSVSSKRYKSIWKSELKLHPELFSTVIVSYHDTRSNATNKELQVQRLLNVVKSELFINRAYASINGFSGASYTTEEKAELALKYANKSDEEKAITKKKQSDAHASKTPLEKSLSIKKRLDTLANRSDDEKSVTGKKISESKLNRTPEEKALTIAKDKATKANRSDEEKAITKKKQSDIIANRSDEEKAITKKKQSDSSLNRTSEEKASAVEKRLNTIANKTPEQKSETRKKQSDSKRGILPPTVECPHCNIVGAGGAMIRWHFKNCKLYISPKV